MENDTTVQPEMLEDSSLPFTNYTSSEFVGKWDGKEYTFPPLTTVSMLGLIASANQDQTRFIRRKFATDLAINVFYQSDKFKAMDLSVADSQAGKTPALYTDKDIAPFIQRCLEPMPKAKAEVKELPRKEPNTRKDAKGKAVSVVLDGSETLVQGQVVA